MKRLDREILKIALPSILANITVPLVGMVDIAVAGHLGGMGAEAMAAATLIGGISIGTMLFDLLYWNFGFLRVGTGGMTAQAYGRGDRAEGARILLRGVTLAVLIALIIIAIQWPFTKLAFLVVDCSPQVRELALKYFFIRIWAAPATLSLMALKGWFIGMQDSISSMSTDLVINVVNIVASIILGLGIPALGFSGIGFAGIAWGTLIAQFSGLAFAIGVAAIKYRGMFRGVGLRNALRGSELKKFMTMNGDLFIRSFCMIVVYVGFTMISAKFGDLLLATGSIMMKLLMLFSYFTDGFAYSGEALTGKYIGMQDKDMTTASVNRIFRWSMAVGLLFVAIYCFGGTPILKLMTSDPEVVGSCRSFFIWLLPMPLVGCAAFTWDGVFVGATAARDLRNSMIWAVAAFFAAWFLSRIFHNGYDVAAMHLLMTAYFAHLTARAVYLQSRYKKAILTEPFGKTE